MEQPLVLSYLSISSYLIIGSYLSSCILSLLGLVDTIISLTVAWHYYILLTPCRAITLYC
jgi:hypothetical protein